MERYGNHLHFADILVHLQASETDFSFSFQNESVREKRDNEEELTPQVNLKTRNKPAKIDLPSEIVHTKSQMQGVFDHVKGSMNDEYEMFGKLIIY